MSTGSLPPVLDYTSERRRLDTQSPWGKVSMGCVFLVIGLIVLGALLANMFGSPAAPNAGRAYKMVFLYALVVPIYVALLMGVITGIVGAFQRSHKRELACSAVCVAMMIYWFVLPGVL